MSIFSLSRIGTAIASTVCILGLSTGAHAVPVTIDFEVNPVTSVPSYTESGVTFAAATPGPSLSIQTLANSGRSIIVGSSPFFPMRADISSGASMVSILVGDNSSDTDDIFLRAFNALDVQIAEETSFLNGLGFVNLTVNAADIAYVIFGSDSTVGGSSVVLDEFTFDQQATQVPEAGAIALFGLGLVGLGFARRKRTT